MKNANRAGFTLIELLVVVLIIGILAAIAVPQYFKVVEKGRFAEVINYASSLKGAQERYLTRTGAYAANVNLLDITPGALSARYTATGAMTVTSNPDGWTVTVTRVGGPTAYGNYAVTFAGPGGAYSCNNTSCTTDLLP